MSKPVLLIRASGNEADADALAKFGIGSVVDPYLQLSIAPDARPALTLLSEIASCIPPIWIIATSANAIEYWAKLVGENTLRKTFTSQRDLHFAAIGVKTAEMLGRYGAKEVLVPPKANSLALAEVLVSDPRPGHAFIPGGNLAMQNLPTSLLAAGWQVSTATVYVTETVVLEPISVQLLRNQEISAILLRSPSAVRALTHFVPSPKIPLVCAGATTAIAVQTQGLKVATISAEPTPTSVAVAVRALLER
jgi:uroporphyrinogen-III synthase